MTYSDFTRKVPGRAKGKNTVGAEIQNQQKSPLTKRLSMTYDLKSDKTNLRANMLCTIMGTKTSITESDNQKLWDRFAK